MKDKIKEIILDIVKENRAVKNGCDYALLTEVKKAINRHTVQTLNEMYKNKEIMVGETINDKWIKLM